MKNVLKIVWFDNENSNRRKAGDTYTSNAEPLWVGLV